MKSIGELALEGHFNRLRDAVNQQTVSSEPAAEQQELALLEDLSQYLKKLENNGQLDAEGLELSGKLSDFLNKESPEGNIPDKLPMAKAGRKSQKDVNRKAG